MSDSHPLGKLSHFLQGFPFFEAIAPAVSLCNRVASLIEIEGVFFISRYLSFQSAENDTVGGSFQAGAGAFCFLYISSSECLTYSDTMN
jgi:hypothetical protein